MAKYFLDTHVFYWFLIGDERLDKNIRESIASPKPKERYIVSEFVLLEILQLKELKKITLVKGLKGVFELMEYYNIGCDNITSPAWLKLENIPMQKIQNVVHSDPFDRVNIANCIQCKYIMVSADTKFPHYRKLGLQLLEIEI